MPDLLGPLHNITGAQLRAFLAVAENGGFNGAAEALDVAQPTISKAIRALEAKTGPLFERRRGSSVRLNDAGQILEQMAPQMIHRFVQLRRRLDAVRGGTVTLRICTGDYLFPVLAAQIAAFHEEQSLVSVRLEHSPSRPRALQHLRLGSFDAVFITEYVRPLDVPDRFVAPAVMAYYETVERAGGAMRPEIRVATLAHRRRGEREFLEAQENPRLGDTLFAPDYRTLVRMCLDGVGYAQMFGSDASEGLASGRLRVLPGTETQCFRTCHFLGDDPLLLAFADRVMRALN